MKKLILEEKPLFLRPKDWVKDMSDSNKPKWTAIKNPLAWIIALIVAPIIIYFRDYF